MLNFLRRRKRSWIIILPLGMIVFTFVLYFGASDWNASTYDTIVEVNGENIRRRELEINLQRSLEVYRDLLKGSLTPENIKNLNLRETVLNELIQRRLLLQEAERLGLVATEEELINVITRLPIFQVNGHFSKERYLQVLRYRRMTPQYFEAEQKDEITIRKLLEMIRDSVHMSDNEIRERYRLESENINLSFLRLSADDFLAEVKVTPEEVKTFYEKNQEVLKEPLRVQAEYLAYPLTHFAAQVQVSEKEAEEFYRTHREKLFHEPKAAKVRQIFFHAPEGGDQNLRRAAHQKAENVLAEAAQGKSFASLAEQYSEDPSNPTGGELGWFTPGQLLPPLEKAVFELKKGAISKVVESPLGYHILKIDDIKGEKGRGFKEVKAQVIAEVKREKARTEAKRTAEEDREKLVSGADFSQVAKERGLRVSVSRLFARHEGLPEVGPAEEFYDKAFSLPAKEISPPLQTPNAIYLLRVTERKEPFVPSFESVRSRIEKDLKSKKAFESALQKANALLTQLMKEKDFAKLAHQHGYKIEETGWFPRNLPQLPNIGPLQEIKAGGIPVSQVQPIPDRIYTQDNVAYLFYFKESRQADMERFEKEKNRLRTEALAQKREQALQKLIENLKARATIKVDTDALEATSL